RNEEKMPQTPANYEIALTMTFLAGLATVIGGMFTFFIKRTNIKALSIGLGFSAGVMIFLSFTEILQGAQKLLQPFYPNNANWMTFFGFTFGMVIAILIDYFIPDHIDENLFGPPEYCKNRKHRHRKENDDENDIICSYKHHKIRRAGILTAIAIAIHNFPEGMATFFVTTQNVTLGISVAIAIALHNIPEGIAVALPIYHATGKKRMAIWYSFLSGISEPIGAIIGLLVMHYFLPQIAIGFLFAAVAGIMIYISFDTLLPLSREYGDGHYSVFGIMSGIFLIWISLLLIK
ncbi:MAG TPA: zinc transporter ZupT, partial [Candidatus Gastranaerophilaceae bacterium]|nr:zinc transporter ZupT [Candidatus Gastranaerophilaceae bacterium]